MKITERCIHKLMGQRYTGNHDYVVRRERYSFHRGRYGWTRTFALWRFAIIIEWREAPQERFYSVRLKRRRFNHMDLTFPEGWGQCNGRGQNHLGRILMKIRSEIND